MKNFNLSSMLIPLFAALAIYLPLANSTVAREEKAEQASAQQLQTPTPPPTPTSTPPPGDDRNRLQTESARLLCDFFGDYFRQEPNAQPKGFSSQIDSVNLKGDYCLLRDIKNDFELDFLVATIPDPKDSRLDYLFDRNLDAIQRAIETAEYVLDRHWLPWERAKQPGLTPAQQQAALTSTRHLMEPGVMVFRRSDRLGLLLVFLVGETPTYGINKLAFQNALVQIEQLSELARGRSSKNSKFSKSDACQFGIEHVRILGPTFTGSANSLALSLKSWLNRPTPPPAPKPPNKPNSSPGKRLSKACVITGTAMAINKPQFIELAGRKDDVNLFATVIPEQESKKAYFQYLVEENKPLRWWTEPWILPTPQENDIERTYIAMLSEGTTSYGLQTRQTQAKPTVSPSPVAGKIPQPSPSPTPLALSMTFPLHISQLRIEAAKVDSKNGGNHDQALLKENKLALPLGETGDHKPKDVVLPFSSMEAVVAEQVLTNMLASIDRERIRYVGVSATDVLDRIFLIRQIRQNSPNTVIFTFSSDLLYLHSEASLDSQGVQIISPYPLFDQNQNWTYPFEGEKRRYQFTTQTAQGVFNATLALLGKPDLMLEYGSPFRKYYRGELRKPALWLTLVGRNGLWPVTTMDYKDPENYVWQASVGVPAEEAEDSTATKISLLAPHLGLIRSYLSPFGLGFLMLLGIICLIPSAVLILQLLLFSLKQHDDSDQKSESLLAKLLWSIRWLNTKLKIGPLALESIRRWRIGKIFGDEDESIYRYRYVRRVYLMACCASLLTVTLFASGVSLLPRWFTDIETVISKADWFQYQIIRIFSYFNFFAVAVAFFWLLVSVLHWTVSGRKHLRGSKLATMSLLIGIVMMMLAFAGLCEISFRVNKVPEQVFFFLRTTDVANGVSLLIPVALLGLASFLTFFSAVRRLNLSERMACLPSPDARNHNVEPAFLRLDNSGSKSFQGVAKIEEKIRELIVGRGISTWTICCFSALILFVYWLLFLLPYMPTSDGKFFDLFFKCMFYLVPMSLILAFVWFAATWLQVRKLLRRLSWHPLIARFAVAHQEEKRFSALPQIDLLSPPPTYTALSLLVRQAKLFSRELEVKVDKASKLAEIKQLVAESEANLSEAMEHESKGDWQDALVSRRNCEERLCELSEEISLLLEPYWDSSNGKEGAEAKPWHDEGKFFLLAHIAGFLQHIFAHMQNLVALVTAGLLLVLMASNSYPFQPLQPLLMFSWVTILTVVAVTLLIFVQVGKDKVLSILSGTTPGKLNLTRDLVFRVLIHGVVPIIALLGAQFPEALRKIFSWLSLMQGGGN